MSEKNDIKLEKIINIGSYGIVCKCKIDNIDSVFKISYGYLNFLVEHEYKIMNGLKELDNFCKTIKVINYPFNIEYLDLILNKTLSSKNHFISLNKSHHHHQEKQIFIDILIMEYIEGKLFNDILKELSYYEILSLVKQILMTLLIAQTKYGFVHYDMHIGNIIITNTDDKNLIYLYRYDADHSISIVPSYGYKPKIIDFGFSKINDDTNLTFNSLLCATDFGLNPLLNDTSIDYRTFLLTLCYSLPMKTKFAKFIKTIKKFYSKIKIKKNTGWLKIFDKFDFVNYITYFFKDEKSFVKKYDCYCKEIFQGLIFYKNKIPDYFINIEEECDIISESIDKLSILLNDFHLLYILHKMITIMRNMIIEKNDDFNIFKSQVYNYIDKIAKFCVVSLNFEKLFNAFKKFSDFISGMIFELNEEYKNIRDAEYSKNPINTNQREIFRIIDNKFKFGDLNFTTDTIIQFYDYVDNKNFSFPLLEKDIQILNECKNDDKECKKYLLNLTREKN